MSEKMLHVVSVGPTSSTVIKGLLSLTLLVGTFMCLQLFVHVCLDAGTYDCEEQSQP